MFRKRIYDKTQNTMNENYRSYIEGRLNVYLTYYVSNKSESHQQAQHPKKNKTCPSIYEFNLHN